MRALIRYLNTIHLFFSYYKFMTCFFINIIKSGRQFLKFMIMTIQLKMLIKTAKHKYLVNSIIVKKLS